MSLKEKINKLKKRHLKEEPKGEKTGILDGLVVLGALAGAIAVTSEASAAPTCDETTHEITDTNLNSDDDGIDTGSWDNHCWWDHAWWDHTWHNWSNWSRHDWTNAII